MGHGLGTIRIDFWFDPDCPRAEAVRHELDQALDRLTTLAVVTEHRGEGVFSPTVMVNDVDVLPGPTPRGRGCRLQVPTAAQILRAITTEQSDEL